MYQALQIMFLTIAISAIVGFLVSFLIFLLTKLVNIGKKSEEQEKTLQNEELELALAVAVVFAGKQPK